MFNRSLLILVRQYRGLTQGQLAQRAGLTQGYLSKIESGMIESPTRDHLERISAELDWPAAFFARQDRVYGFGTACMYHRKRSALPIATLKRVEGYANILRLSLAPALNEIEFQSPYQIPVMDIDEYDDDPEVIATIVRGQWRLPTGPIQSMVEVIESAGGLIYEVDMGTRQLDAVSHWDPGMPPMFLVSSHAPADRVRFSLAHELGHVVMHRLPTSSMEQEADRFASAFLMPADEIRPQLRGLTLERAAGLKPYWRVAMSALIYRAKQLDAITPRQATNLYKRMSARGYRRTEPVTIPGETPTLVRELFDVQMREHGTTMAELARNAEVPPAVMELHIVPRPRLAVVT